MRIFGVGVALWSVSAVARTLIEGWYVTYSVAETRRGGGQMGIFLAFGPILALGGVVSGALLFVGTPLVGGVAEVVDPDELFVRFWGWLRFPVALFLLGAVLTVVYRFGPNARQRFRSVALGAALAVTLWAISSVAFAFYLANFANIGFRVREHRSRRGFAPCTSTCALRWCCWCGAQRGDLSSGQRRNQQRA